VTRARVRPHTPGRLAPGAELVRRARPHAAQLHRVRRILADRPELDAAVRRPLYVYPLRFLSTLVLGSLIDPASLAAIEPAQLSQLIVIYGLGYVAVLPCSS